MMGLHLASPRVLTYGMWPVHRAAGSVFLAKRNWTATEALATTAPPILWPPRGRTLHSTPIYSQPDSAGQGREHGFLDKLKLRGPEQITLDAAASDRFNRWRLMPAAVATHASLGSILAWSIFNNPLTHAIGVVAPAAADWTLTETIPTFAIAMSTFGLTAAVLGYFGVFERMGPRRALALGGGAYATGFALACAGFSLHSLPLIYVGWVPSQETGFRAAYVCGPYSKHASNLGTVHLVVQPWA